MKQPELSHSDGTSPCLRLLPMHWLPLASTGHVVFSLARRNRLEYRRRIKCSSAVEYGSDCYMWPL